MTQAYRIVNWVRLYEVDSDGHAVRRFEKPPSVEKLRKSPLPYIRLENTGHAQTVIDRKINEKAWIAGQMAEMAVHGLFDKLLLMAGNQPRQFRGWILDERQNPLTAKGIAESLGIFEVGCVQKALGILTAPEVGLLSVGEFGENLLNAREAGQTCAEMRRSPDVCALFKNETEIKESKPKETESKPSASIFTPDVSDSAGAQQRLEAIKQARSNTVGQICQILRFPNTPSNITTFQDIFDQIEQGVIQGELTTEIFDRIIDEAKDAASFRFKKIGRFVNAMKREPFGYIPERRKVTAEF